jgi:2-(1,2-epoxy-1,2-dihydrophenyl)acetyl-CoA isomerase
MSTILFDVTDGVAHLRLNRPDVSNAVDLPTAFELTALVDRVAAEDDIRVLVVSGEGARFCAGGDVRSMVANAGRSAEVSYVEELAQVLDAALLKMAAVAKPVLCAVHGAVAGAGLAVMLSCDVIVAEPQTKFVMAYSAVGLTPDCGLSWLLPRAIGQQRALAFAITGATLSAAEALDHGLIAAVDADPLTRAQELARRIAGGPAEALGETRRLLRDAWARSRAETGADESATIARVSTTPYAAAAIGRFAR